MPNEASKPEYFIDAWWIEKFGKFPRDCNPDDFFPEQREFVMLLCGNSPTRDELRGWAQYRKKRQDLLDKDFAQKIRDENDPDVLMISAGDQGIEAYLKSRGERYRKISLTKLHDDYYGKSEEREKDQKIVEKSEITDAMSAIRDAMNENPELFEDAEI